VIQLISNELIKTIANDMLKTKQTVRELSKVYKISKSAIHKYLTYDLQKLDLNLYNDVHEILQYNKKIRHLRGGFSTKIKYQNMTK
jgi:putative DeoR family transcriptional regulator (stage III sporulation protein D)